MDLDSTRNSQRNKMAEYTFIFLCALILVLLLCRDVGNIYLSKWIFLFLTVVVFLCYDIHYSAIFICFLIPLIRGMPNSYIFSVALVILLVKNLTRLAVKSHILFLFAIFLVELLSFVYGGFSIGNYIRFVAPLLLISVLIFNDKGDLNYTKMLLYFVIAAIGAQISIILQTINVSGFDNFISAGIRLGNTADLLSVEGIRISYNPNGLSMLCMMVISILLIFFSRVRQYKIFVLAILVLEVFVGGMSLSRSYLVLISFAALIYYLSIAKSLKRFLTSIVIFTIISIALYGAIYHYTPGIIENYTERLERQDITGGRLDISEAYFTALADNPERLFLGAGIQNYPAKYSMEMSSHNAIQEVILAWGVVGLILVCLYIFYICKHGWNDAVMRDQKMLYLLPMILLLIGIQSGQFFSSSVTPMYLLPAYASIRLVNVYDDKVLDAEKVKVLQEQL